jgi:protocatechuate 3,4-dioxygenase beta subunit
LAIVVGFAALVLTASGAPRVNATACPPTDADMLGPFYVAGAPELRRTGEGLAVRGVARSTRECTALPGAKIEWWSANATGEYDALHRATQITARDGRFRYTTDMPAKYPGPPVHLHVKVSAPGHKTLVAQVYPKPSQKEVALDFVLLAD